MITLLEKIEYMMKEVKHENRICYHVLREAKIEIIKLQTLKKQKKELEKDRGFMLW